MKARPNVDFSAGFPVVKQTTEERPPSTENQTPSPKKAEETQHPEEKTKPGWFDAGW